MPRKQKDDYLAMLFDIEMRTLRAHSTPQFIMEFLEKQRYGVLAMAGSMNIALGNLPFLPVIPLSFRALPALMSMVKMHGSDGKVIGALEPMAHKVATPPWPYFAYDVEDGDITSGQNPNSAEVIIYNKARSPLVLAEAIALATHTNVLAKHFLFAIGSRTCDTNRFPFLIVSFFQPTLIWKGNNDEPSYKEWGSPSCADRALLLIS